MSASVITITRGKPLFARHWDHGLAGIPTPEATYTKQAGSWPTGISLDSYGNIVGTTSDSAGDVAITIRANNGGANVDHSLTLRIVEPVTIADGMTTYDIYYFNKDGGTNTGFRAATELADALNALVSGSNPFTVTNGTSLSGTPPSTGFVIGDAFPNLGAGWEVPDCPDVYQGAQNPWRLSVKMIGNVYYLTGGHEDTYITAVRWFLERYFGFIYPYASLTPDSQMEESWNMKLPGSLVRKDPTAAALPLTAPQVDERVLYRYCQSMRGSGEWETQDFREKMGWANRDAKYGHATSSNPGGAHQAKFFFTDPVMGHPTQGEYARAQTAFVVKNPGSVGITGTFKGSDVDETITVKRGGVATGVTAKLTFPGTGLSKYVFAYNLAGGVAGDVQDGDTIHGANGSATVTGWVTNAVPLIFPVVTPGDDPYDPTKRTALASVPEQTYLCRSDPSLPLLISYSFRRFFNSHTATERSQYLYFLPSPDNYGLECFCTRCQAAYADGAWTRPNGVAEDGHGETIIRLMNAVVADARSYAGWEAFRMMMYAYYSQRSPGAMTDMAAGTYIFIPHLHNDITHSFLGASSPDNRGFSYRYAKWLEMADANDAGVLCWDYPVRFGGNFMAGFPQEGCFESFRRCREGKIRRYDLQCPNGTGGHWITLKGWIYATLAWEPQYSPRYLAHYYIDMVYGAAATACKAAYDLIEDSVFDENGYPITESDEFQSLTKSFESWLTDEMVDDLTGYRTTARAAISGNATLEELVEQFFTPMLASFEGFLMGSPQTDRDNIGTWSVSSGMIYRDLADGKGSRDGYTDLLLAFDNNRGCPINENSNGPLVRVWALSRAGGEIVTLTSGSLVVRLAVNLNRLSIYDIKYGGVNVIPLTSPADNWAPGGTHGVFIPAFNKADGTGNDSIPLGGSWHNSGQYVGGDYGGRKLSGTDGTGPVKWETYCGLRSSKQGHPQPDYWAYASATVGTDGSGYEYLEITWSVKLQATGTGTNSQGPSIYATYPSGTTITKDVGNNRYDATTIPSLTGITVRDQFSDYATGITLSDVYTDDPAPECRAVNKVGVTARFAASGGTVCPGTSETTLMKRRITIIDP